MDYISYSKDQLKILKGLFDLEDIISDIPKEIKLKQPLNLNQGISELELERYVNDLKKKNHSDYIFDFQGAGIYNHFIPAIVDSLASRSEFLTAYTPYQAEMSQGLLQTIFEYQTCIVNLTGMEVCNASLYDGATSVFEAVKLAINAVKRSKILISKNMHPEYIETLETSLVPLEDINLVYFDDLVDLQEKCDQDIASVIISNPNFYGQVEDIKKISDIAHENGALSIVSIYPISLGILEKPGDLGADVVIGEGQSLGMPTALGGATLGLFATKKKYLRLMPGRIVGKTTDDKDNDGFVLTMQAREQHIRREKALSNICSNHAHYALRALIYLACMGDKGLENVAKKNMENTYYLNQKLSKMDFFEVVQKNGFFNEFVVRLKDGIDFGNFDKRLRDNGIILGVKLDDRSWLVCVTEIFNKEEIDKAVEIIEDVSTG